MRDELALTTTLFQDKEKQIAMLMQELEEEQSTRLREKNSSSVKINKTEEERDKMQQFKVKKWALQIAHRFFSRYYRVVG